MLRAREHDVGPQLGAAEAIVDAQLRRFCELGMSFSAAAENEMSQGHGHPITGRLLELADAQHVAPEADQLLGGRMGDLLIH